MMLKVSRFGTFRLVSAARPRSSIDSRRSRRRRRACGSYNQGLIDIHSHVLYGLDDGARTREDSLAMIRMAAEHGTTDLVATPHANLQYRFDPKRIAQELEELTSASGGALRLHSGCDFHLSFDNIQDAIQNPGKY